MSKKTRGLYETLNITKKEFEEFILPKLDDDAVALLHLRYGDDFENPNSIVAFPLGSDNYKAFYGRLLPKLRRRVAKLNRGVGFETGKSSNSLQPLPAEDVPVVEDIPNCSANDDFTFKNTVVENGVNEDATDVFGENIESPSDYDLGDDGNILNFADGEEKNDVSENGTDVLDEIIETSSESGKDDTSDVDIIEPDDLDRNEKMPEKDLEISLNQFTGMDDGELDAVIAQIVSECKLIEARIAEKRSKLDEAISIFERRNRLLERERELDREIEAKIGVYKMEGDSDERVVKTKRNDRKA